MDHIIRIFSCCWLDDGRSRSWKIWRLAVALGSLTASEGRRISMWDWNQMMPSTSWYSALRIFRGVLVWHEDWRFMRTGWLVSTWIFFGNQKSWLRKWAVFRSAWLCASWLSFIALAAKFMDLLINWGSFSKLCLPHLQLRTWKCNHGLYIFVTQNEPSNQPFSNRLFTLLGRRDHFSVTIFRSFAGVFDIFYRIRLSDLSRHCLELYS